jgi:hypothetical protein
MKFLAHGSSLQVQNLNRSKRPLAESNVYYDWPSSKEGSSHMQGQIPILQMALGNRGFMNLALDRHGIDQAHDINGLQANRLALQMMGRSEVSASGEKIGEINLQQFHNDLYALHGSAIDQDELHISSGSNDILQRKVNDIDLRYFLRIRNDLLASHIVEEEKDSPEVAYGSINQAKYKNYKKIVPKRKTKKSQKSFKDVSSFNNRKYDQSMISQLKRKNSIGNEISELNKNNTNDHGIYLPPIQGRSHSKHKKHEFRNVRVNQGNLPLPTRPKKMIDIAGTKEFMKEIRKPPSFESDLDLIYRLLDMCQSYSKDYNRIPLNDIDYEKQINILSKLKNHLKLIIDISRDRKLKTITINSLIEDVKNESAQVSKSIQTKNKSNSYTQFLVLFKNNLAISNNIRGYNAACKERTRHNNWSLNPAIIRTPESRPVTRNERGLEDPIPMMENLLAISKNLFAFSKIPGMDEKNLAKGLDPDLFP